MTIRCDLCGSGNLKKAYHPDHSTRGLTVYVCGSCALVQSLPRIDRVPDRRVAVSGEADWGNIRYGKGFRTAKAISLLENHLAIDQVRTCLDVGSSRGSFIQQLFTRSPHCQIMAVEPDETVVEPYRHQDRIQVLVHRIEEVRLPEAEFDLIYCSHTLEHVRSPFRVLQQMRNALSPQGILFLEVPNLQFIDRDDVLEEWFIDKHLYHFSGEVLRHLLQQTGFDLVECQADASLENLSIVARKGQTASGPFPTCEDGHVRRVTDLLTRYSTTRERNRQALARVAREIHELGQQERIVMWGAGRIFDVLIRKGGLDPRVFHGLIDSYLSDYTARVHGCRVHPPSALPALNPDLVLVASREYFDEIREQVRSLLPNCPVRGVMDWVAESPEEGKTAPSTLIGECL